MQFRSIILSVFAVTLLSFVVAGCSTTGRSSAIPKPGALPSGRDFTAVWHSEQFDQMNLRQSGEDVTGIFMFKSGGTIKGKVDGNLLLFEWNEPGNREQARRGFKGHGYLQLIEQGDNYILTGRWGYEDSYVDGGIWKASYLRPLQSTDSLNLTDFDKYGR